MVGSLWLAVLLPVAFMPVVYLLGRQMGGRVAWVAALPLVYTTLSLVRLMPVVSGAPVAEYLEWLPGVRFGFYLDGLSLPIAALVAFLSVVAIIYSAEEMGCRIPEMYGGENPRAHATYYAVMLAYAASMVGVVLSTNLFQFYMFFELMIIPSYMLINVYGSGEKEKTALSYLLWSIVGAVIFFTGVLMAYGVTGSYEITSLAQLGGTRYAGVVTALFVVGMGVKLAMLGVHFWQPAAYAEAPTAVSALLSPAMSGLAAYSMARMLLPVSGALQSVYTPALAWGLATMVYGGLMALSENDVKRMLAYSSMSQMGYIFIGVASANALGATGGMLHYITHAFGKAALFFCAGVIIQRTGVRDIRELGGLASKMPLTATVFLLGALNLAGIPPTVGYPSKMMVFMGALGPGVVGGDPVQFTLGLVALVSTALTVAYTTWAMRRIFFGPLPEHLNGVRDAPALMGVAMALVAGLSLLLGVYPRPVFDLVAEAVSNLVV